MEITMNDVRAWMTVVQVVVFLGIVWWAYGATRRGRFEEAAKLVLDDDTVAGPATRGARDKT